jgi:anti-anti-sigma factor
MDLQVENVPLANGHAATVVSVIGELDVATSEQLSQLGDNGDVMRGPLVFDLSGCSFLDSVAVGRIVRLTGLVDANGEPVRVAVIAPHGTQLGRVLALAGGEGRLAIYETLDGALATIGVNGNR